ncbi:MAG: MXAN_2562 family outer membrane beta-barrel protein [bacterium]
MKFITPLLAVTGLVVGAQAFALTPETSSLVSTTTLSAPRALKLDGTTAYYGISECQSAYTDDAKIDTTFTTLVDPNQTSGSNTRLEGAYYFAVPRDSGTAVICPGEKCTEIDDGDYTTTTTTVVPSVPFRALVGVTSAEACDGFDSEFFTRINLREADAEDTTVVPTDSRIIVDTIRPGAPPSFSFEVTENKITASWELPSDDDVIQYGVYYSTTEFTGGGLADSTLKSSFIAGADRTSADFTVSLAADETVYVAMVAVDETGNESLLSTVQTATVVQTSDFWELYKGAGGSETGGCDAGAGMAAWMLLGVAGLFRRRSWRLTRKSKVLVASVLASSTLLVATDAFADSPISGSMELKLGGYYPAIDDEFGGNGPYAAVFGTDWNMYGEFEIGFFFWQGFGKLGTTYHLGYSSATGSALAADGTKSSDETTFTTIPNRASLVYRFDILQEKLHIPLVPVAKAGLDYVLWYSEGGNGDTSKVGNDSASGGKWGYHGALSLQFLLDVIDPSSAATFDMNWGVNNSYFFAEYMMTKIDDFGGTGLDLSDNMWLFGLAFEF